MFISTLAVLAIVTQNQTPVRAAPRESATRQAVLWQGDLLEVRGQSQGYLKVYDHRRERSGYVKATLLRPISLAPEQAPELLSVVRFLRETPGAEALGIAYAAAYLKAAPAAAITAEPFDALGSMADRLAQRATTNASKANENALSAHLEVVAQYGVVINGIETGGGQQFCYDGEMFRRVLAMKSADSEQRARAAFGLTRPECRDSRQGPSARYADDQWRAQVLDGIEARGLDEALQARLHLRRAGLWASIAFGQSRRGESTQVAGARALQELSAVVRSAVAEEDQAEYADAGIRVGASRWAAEDPGRPTGKVWVQTNAGAPGETCVLLLDAKHDAGHALARRCTYGTVWPASASANAQGTALALGVQPLEAWRELWLFRATAEGWVIDVLPPGTEAHAPGYLEFAGWVPGAQRMLAAREIVVAGGARKRFEIISLESLATEHWAVTPEYLTTFLRWQEPRWKRLTVAMR